MGVGNSSAFGDLPDGGKRLLELAVAACANAVIITDAKLPEGREFYGVLRNRRKDGSDFFNEMHVAPVRDGDGALTHFVGIQNDATERRELEDQLAHQAFHDPLTGLPNRALFVDRLEQAIARTARSGRHAAALFADLDNFKDVNDSLGHETGDRLLVAVAERLR